MSADAKMEERICGYLRENGQRTALVISKEFSIDKKIVNQHLYNLARSKQVFKTDDQPPLWNLLENHSEKTDEEEGAAAAAAQATDASCEEERVKVLLKSGDLKASRIARDLGLEIKAVKKKLYSMMERGDVQKCSRNNTWTLSKGAGNEDSDHGLASLSGSSQSFVVIETLGRGGFGRVYKVKHKFDGKIYAVKQVVLTGKADSEAKALAHLDHPNIVRYITCWPDSANWTGERNQQSNTSGSSSDGVIFERSGAEESNYDDDDYDDEDDEDDITSGMESLSLKKASAKTSGNYSADDLSPSNNRTYLFIQMEFCEGGTLTSWINDRNFMHKQRETVETNKIFYEIISGVEYIHSQKLIHRDLKPDNILFSTNGKVKIGDFGLVAVQENHSKGARDRTVGRGTELYMSPEQGSSKRYNEKTDIFPLGLIWFEMLWKLSTYMERDKLLKNLRNQIFPEGFCTLYVTENNLIKKMLSLTPGDRPSAQDIKQKMEELFYLDQNPLSQRTI